jgi:hypothetical protein
MKPNFDFRRWLGAHGEDLSWAGQFLPFAGRKATPGWRKNRSFAGVFKDKELIFNMAQPLLKGGL